MPSEIEMYCYCCEEPTAGDEHVPPQSFFVKGNRAGLITVPSCKLHNQDKSSDDEYIRTLLLSSIELDEKQALASNMEVHDRALRRSAERLLSRLKSDADLELFIGLEEKFKDDPLVGIKVFAELEKSGIGSGLLGIISRNYREETIVDSDGIEQLTTSFQFDRVRLMSYFKLMSKALFYHETKWPWLGDVVLIPHNFVSNDATEDEKALHAYYLALIDREASKGEHKDIFYYTIFTQMKSDIEIRCYVVNFCIYDNFKFTALFISENYVPHKERS